MNYKHYLRYTTNSPYHNHTTLRSAKHMYFFGSQSCCKVVLLVCKLAIKLSTPSSSIDSSPPRFSFFSVLLCTKASPSETAPSTQPSLEYRFNVVLWVSPAARAAQPSEHIPQLTITSLVSASLFPSASPKAAAPQCLLLR